ncbi:unnamed protein product [Darwinula stevensoni]|uniref:3'(2'),5'-bisphosphate nucleotidase 1 n=1 Tax=Darwinula stevensoni TaxID=69355 RepID=A0A7R8WZQ1_9CRUS|nr:unnamed protein product [Darwinula stevensoni]CAG0878540.1 unnamed protein product [Darwinula stevensoni]
MSASQCPLIFRLMACSIGAANKAGSIIRDVSRKSDFGVVEKAKDDLQTEADRSSQRCIVASLKHSFPDLTVIGEEEGLNMDLTEIPSDWIVSPSPHLQHFQDLNCPENWACLQPSEVVVWVDPMDGTSEFTEGLLDMVTVLIGVSHGGRAIGGVIHQPFFSSEGRTVWALEGLPIFPPIGKIGSRPPGSRDLTTTRSHRSKVGSDCIEAFKPSNIVRSGGAGNKVLMVVEGKVDAYVYASTGTKKWDTCAPEAILRAAGGILTDIHGSPLPYDRDAQHMNARGILASRSLELHEELLAMVPQHVKDALS